MGDPAEFVLQMFSLNAGKNLDIHNMCKSRQMSLTMDFTNTGKPSQFLYFLLFFKFSVSIIIKKRNLETTSQIYRHTVHLYISFSFFLLEVILEQPSYTVLKRMKL